jgi:glycosyltransferase involved in cell wall biosynthesis
MTNMSRKQALFVFERMDMSGGPKMAVHFCSALVADGWDVVAAGPRRGERSQDSEALLSSLRESGVRADAGPRGLWGFLRWSWGYCIGKQRPELVVAVYPADLIPVLLVALACGARVLFYDQNQKQFGGAAWIKSLKVWVLGSILHAGGCQSICVSEAVRDEMKRRAGLSRQSQWVIYPGASRPGITRTMRLDLSVGTPLKLLNVGRIDNQKGQHILLQAVARQTSALRGCVSVDIVGAATQGDATSMRYAAECEAYASRHGLDSLVNFCGWRRDVPELLAHADGYVHSALWEGFPLAVIEAMMMGCPTIFTDCSGVPAGMPPGAALVVPAGDVNALGEAIVSLIRMPARSRILMGELAKEYAMKTFALDVVRRRLAAAALGYCREGALCL